MHVDPYAAKVNVKGSYWVIAELLLLKRLVIRDGCVVVLCFAVQYSAMQLGGGGGVSTLINSDG